MGPELPLFQCPQCGFMHPPLEQGAKCPMAKEKDSRGNEIDLTQFFSSLKNILISQIKSKEIKDPQKLMSYILVGVTKLIERYKMKE